MDVIDLENSTNYTDNSCYRFNSRIAVLLEKNHKWKDAMLQWIFVVQLAKHLENKVWAYQRALYCRKQYINHGGQPELSESDIFQELQFTRGVK
ncbi:ANR family transcriptional regulator [Enterobacter asburiae]